MRKIIICDHVTLDGFVAGSNREMDWIKLDDAMFDLVGTFTDVADTALYGRITYEMMDSYWPTAADGPNPSKHDIEHSAWYNKAEKVVLSKTMKGQQKNKTTFISENVADEITKLKQQPGANILMFGSPTAGHALMKHNLIDEYWLFVNPVLLGQGISLFGDIKERIALKLADTKTFSCGVAGLNYVVER